jgi:hypothetical protein
MLPALGALGALSGLLNSLGSSSSGSSSTKTTSFSNPFESKSGGSSGQSWLGSSQGGSSFPSSGLSPETMNALLAAQSQSTSSTTTAAKSRDAALKDLFAQIDGNGDGSITKDEFESALGAGGTNIANADSVFSKLDSDGDGNVSLDELSKALKSGKRHHHGQSASGASDPLLQALSGASSSSVANSDGSTTTSITYADGSKVTMTSAATGSTGSGNASSSYNFIEQLIQRQSAQLQAAASSVSVSA